MKNDSKQEEEIKITPACNKGTSDDAFAIGYMCQSAFEYELGYTRCRIWNSIARHRAECSCNSSVEVTIRFNRFIKGIKPPVSKCRDVPELLSFWRIAADHIHKAKLLIPVELLDPNELKSLGVVDGILQEFQEKPRESDLQFALRKLNNIGHLNMCGEPFWREMLEAAEMLGLIFDRKRFKYVLDKLNRPIPIS